MSEKGDKSELLSTELQIQQLRNEIIACKRALNLFLQIDSTFLNAQLSWLNEKQEQSNVAAAVLAARLALGEDYPIGSVQ